MDGSLATRARRRFTISDGMILIAATAVGLGWTASVWKLFVQVNQGGSGSSPLLRVILGIAVGLPCVVMWTLAWIGLRLRGPRPSWRKVSRLPGTTASLTALIALAVLTPMAGIYLAIAIGRKSVTVREVWEEFPAAAIELLIMATPIVAFSVLISWVLLAVQRRWRCEPSWLDRSGRALGTLWVFAGSLIGFAILKEYFP